jgi:hypothetical protein
VWQPLNIAEDSTQRLKISLVLSISHTVVILNTYEDKAERVSAVNEPHSDNHVTFEDSAERHSAVNESHCGNHLIHLKRAQKDSVLSMSRTVITT